MTIKDWEEWLYQTIVYSIAIPAAIVFLTALGNHSSLIASWDVTYYAIISAAVNLLIKFRAGIDPNQLASFTQWLEEQGDTSMKTPQVS